MNLILSLSFIFLQVEKHDALCILPLNIVNEKIYIFLWFWLLLLGCLSTLVVAYRLGHNLAPLLPKLKKSPAARYIYISSSVCIVDSQLILCICSYYPVSKDASLPALHKVSFSTIRLFIKTDLQYSTPILRCCM